KNHLLSVYLEISKRCGSLLPNSFPTYQTVLQAYTLLLSRLPTGHPEVPQGNEMFKLWERLGDTEVNRYVAQLRIWLQERSRVIEESDDTITFKQSSSAPPPMASKLDKRIHVNDWFWDSSKLTIFYIRSPKEADNFLKSEESPFHFYWVVPSRHVIRHENDKIEVSLVRLQTPQEEERDHAVVSRTLTLDISTAERLGIIERKDDRFDYGTFLKHWVIAIPK